ncbi:MAG: DUF11 domain-containing protein [Deltaproteobacteria bacterium]|uniref:DUF11 domain-containing protein n=1 Tax=Candidatus Zymogenus saltonus TaxID=2844893 RepID=A0A9D8KE24_9DELT|nr:DUF11 domain-containing protein [Candidatus Zymogenus saltonus]
MGRYDIGIKGVCGGNEVTTYVELVVEPDLGDFGVSAAPPTRTINAGEDTFYTVITKFEGSFGGPVYLSVSGLPAGVTGTFDDNPVSENGGSGNKETKLRISSSSSVPEGHYYLTITGSNDDLGERSTKVKLIINGVAGFVLDADPSSVSIFPGDTAAYEITGDFEDNFNDKVKLTVSGVPAGATDEITPSTIDPKNKKAKLVIKTNSTIKDNNYTITVTGKGEGTGVESKVTVDLAVGVPPVVEPGRLSVSKSAHPSKSKIGGLVSYTLRIRNSGGGDIDNVIVRDDLPNGFGYVRGSTILSGKKYKDPSGTNNITWNIGKLSGGSSVTLKYIVVIKGNVKRGANTNRVKVSGRDGRGVNLTATASADVSISWDSIEDYGKIKGRVFYDKNKNGIKNVDEEGIPGITILMERGTKIVTDKDGLFLFEKVTPGNHLVALDERKIPGNYFLISDSSKIVSVFWGGTARTSFALGYNPPAPPVKPVDKEEEKKKKEAEELAKKKKEMIEKLKKERELLLKSGVVSGLVFIDDNDNERYDKGEEKIEGVIVVLDDSKTSKSNKFGKYKFEKVKEGRHTISVKETKEFKKEYKAPEEKIKISVKRGVNNLANIPLVYSKEIGGIVINIELTTEQEK